MVENVGNILDAAQRKRLLAVQKTAGQLGVAFARLASGFKINSALDGSGSFFAARALRYRAHDLTRLLDGIGQNIQAIKAAEQAIRAQQKILDQAEAYLLDLESRYLAGEIGPGSGPAPNETPVTFSGIGDLIEYVAGQDVPATGAVTVTGTDEVMFSGSLWKRKALNYTVTADTVLVFEYRSTAIQEVSAIGFDNDKNIGNDNDRFWLYGSQLTGLNYSAPLPTFAYGGSGGWERIEIPIGQYFTGNYTHIAFINDDDLAPYGNSSFRGITLREGPEQAVSDGAAFEEEYAKILSQLDFLAEDARYRDVNLLRQRDMTTYFNEDGTGKLHTEAMDSTSAGLGLEADDLNSLEAVREKLGQVRAARDTLRQYVSTISSDLGIVQTRQEYTQSQVEIHKAGADLLTLADMNEEGAKLLALQTRQQIQMSILTLRTANIFSILA